VKFYRRRLHDECLLEGAPFDGFVHVGNWVPQRLSRRPPRTHCLGDQRSGRTRTSGPGQGPQLGPTIRARP